jgi:hypothetical protein
MKGTLMAFEDDIHLAFEQWLSPIGLRRESDGLHLQVDFGAFLEFLIWEAGTGRLVQLLIKLFGVSSREKLQSYDFSVYEYEFGVFEPVEVEVSFDRTEPGAVVAFTSNSEPLGLVHFSPAKFKTRRDLHVRAQVSHYTLMVLALFLKGRLVPGDLTSEKDLYRILRRRETWERAPAITSQRKGVQGE